MKIQCAQLTAVFANNGKNPVILFLFFVKKKSFFLVVSNKSISVSDFDMWLVEVCYRKGRRDALGEGVKSDIAEDLRIKTDAVSFVDVYKINAGLGAQEIEKIAKELLSDPIIQEYAINKPVSSGFDWEIVVELNPDVTDNVGMAAKRGIEDLLGRKLGEEEVRYARKYLIKGKLSEAQVKKICTGLLANSVIEKYTYKEGKK